MIEIAIAGAFGGLLKSILESKGRVILPYIEFVKDKDNNSVPYVYLGFVSNMLLGAFISYYTMPNIASAFTTGISSSFLIEKAVESDKIIKSLHVIK